MTNQAHTENIATGHKRMIFFFKKSITDKSCLYVYTRKKPDIIKKKSTPRTASLVVS